LNKDTGRYFSHEDIDIFLDMAQMDEFNMLIGNTRGTSKVRLGMDRGIDEELLPFERRIRLGEPETYEPLTDFYGLAYKLPPDLMYITLIFTADRQAKVELLSKHEVNARLESYLMYPAFSKPIAMLTVQFQDKILKRYPKGNPLSELVLFYLERPAKPKFAYTLNGRVVTYDIENSVQLRWNDRSIDNIIKRACAYAGANMGEADILQYNEQKQQSGL
jgi:hypothetical protein